MNIYNYIKKNDYERYLCSIFVSASMREDLLVLYAFNQEIAKIPEMTSEAHLSLIRLKWWEEAVVDIYKGVSRSNYIVESLSKIIKKYNLPYELFKNIFTGRSMDCQRLDIQTKKELYDYLDMTSSSLNKLAIHILGTKNNKDYEYAQYLGRAYALTGVLRTIRYLRHNNKMLCIPAEYIDRYNLTRNEFVCNKYPDKIKLIVNDVLNLVDENMLHIDNKNIECKNIFLMQAIVNQFRSRVTKLNYDIFEPKSDVNYFLALCRMLKLHLWR